MVLRKLCAVVALVASVHATAVESDAAPSEVDAIDDEVTLLSLKASVSQRRTDPLHSEPEDDGHEFDNLDCDQVRMAAESMAAVMKELDPLEFEDEDEAEDLDEPPEGSEEAARWAALLALSSNDSTSCSDRAGTAYCTDPWLNRFNGQCGSVWPHMRRRHWCGCGSLQRHCRLTCKPRNWNRACR